MQQYMALYRSMGRRRAANVADPGVVALLVEMARSRRGVLLNAFAEKRGYPPRAVYGSRDTLVKAGALIRQHPERQSCLQLMEGWMGWMLPAIVGAARNELKALRVARQLASGLRGTSVGRSRDDLSTKLTSTDAHQSLPLAVGARAPFSVGSVPAIKYGEHRATIECLTDEIEHRCAVRIQYRTPDRTTTERPIDPDFLHWAARSVPARRTIERAFRVWHREVVEHVQVLFTGRIAGQIRERRWHGSQRLIDEQNGGVSLHLDISVPAELERWLLGFGTDAVVLEPLRLAERIQSQDTRAANTKQVIEACTPNPRSITLPPTASVAGSLIRQSS